MIDRLRAWLNARDRDDVEGAVTAIEWADILGVDPADPLLVDRSEVELIEAARYYREIDVAESDSDDDELAARRVERVDDVDSDPEQLDEPLSQEPQ